MTSKRNPRIPVTQVVRVYGVYFVYVMGAGVVYGVVA
jgi:hypothetical protein